MGKSGGIKKGFLEMMKGKQGNKKKTKVACANLANLGASGASKVNSFGAELEPACGGVKAFFKSGSVWGGCPNQKAREGGTYQQIYDLVLWE
ncbi:hypothetical protein GOBAR_DD28386 [Gossypium barbadense]|nr:hypothetical protein GOBAR_DD28386 [Gossypium barbadense]